MKTSQQGPFSDVDTAGKKRARPQRRQKASGEIVSPEPSLLSDPDVVEPLPQTASIAPRRSKRLKAQEHSTATDPTGIASTDLLKSVAQSRPKQKTARNPRSIVSAKPDGICKRQQSSKQRGKARKGK